MSFVERVDSWSRRSAVTALAFAAGLLVTTAAVPGAHLAPGASFRISTATRVYPGDTPRGQDDEVMRGRGVAVAGGKSS